MAKKGTKIGDYTRPRLNKIIDQRVAAEISEGAGVDTTGTPADNQIAIFTDSNTLEGSANLTFDGNQLAIGGNSVTTGTVINVTADGLTTGTVLNIVSDSSDTSDRTLVKIHNDNTAATGVQMVHLLNDAIGGTDDPILLIESTAAESKPILEIKNSNVSTIIEPEIKLSNTTTSEADGMSLGRILFSGNDSGDNNTDYAHMVAFATDVTNTDEGGQLDFYVYAGGTAGTAASTNLLRIGGEDVANGTPCKVVVNDAGIDCDFRVESDNEPYMFFVDGGNNRVLIGSGSTFTDAGPTVAATLEVTNNASAGAYNVPLVKLTNNDTDKNALQIVSNGLTSDTVNISSTNTASKTIYIENSGLASHTAIGDQIHAIVSISATNRRTSPFLELRKAHENDTAPVLSFKDESETPADDRGIGVMQWIGWDSNDEYTIYAQISGSMSDFTNGDEGGKIAFEVSAGGTAGTAALKNLLSIGGEDVANSTPCEVVVNDDSINCDFRVESDNEPYMLFVDGGNNRTLIGSGSTFTDAGPTVGATLEITNNASAGSYNVPLLQLNSNDVDQIALDVNAANTTANVIDITADAVTTGKVISVSADALTAGSGSMLSLVSDSSSGLERSLVKIHNDNTSANKTNCLHILNDAGMGTLESGLQQAPVLIETTAADASLLELRGSGNHTGRPPTLTFNRSDTGSDADGMLIGSIDFYATNDANEAIKYANITIEADDFTDATESGQMEIDIMSNGTSTSFLKMGGDRPSIHFNDGGIDCDFIIESNDNATMFYIDGADNKVSVRSTARAQQDGFAVFNDYQSTAFESTLTVDGYFGSAEVLKYSPGAADTPTSGQIFFLHTDGTWDAADASAVATGGSQLLGVFPGGSGNTQTRGLVTRGFIRIPSTEILNTPGSGAVDGLPLYISTTAGHFDFTAPSASGEFVRIVGYAIDDDSSDVLVFFDPDKTFVEIA